MYEVFEADTEKKDIVDDILSDDLISRQNTYVRDGSTLGFKENVLYVMVEGSEESVEKARDMFDDEKIETSDNSEEVKDKLKEEDEAAAQGIGTVFG